MQPIWLRISSDHSYFAAVSAAETSAEPTQRKESPCSLSW
jgi:hypothetical protein